MFEKLIWQHDRMLLDDLVFRIEHNKNDGWDLGKDCFKFYKIEGLVDRYRDAFSQKKNFHPQNIFELGIWDGGSVAFWFEYFQPSKHVAIDFQDWQDSSYFQHYVDSRGLRERIKTYWATDQADLAKAFPNADQTLLDFEQGKFLYAPSIASGDLDNYGHACIPKGYVLTYWAKQFDFAAFIDDRTVYPQNVIAVKKPV